METREDRIYRENKAASSALTAQFEENLKRTGVVASSLVNRSTKSAEMLSPADSNPLIVERARIRQRLHQRISYGHTLEVCIKTENPLLVSALPAVNQEVGSGVKVQVTVVSSKFMTEVPDLAQAGSRLDQIVLVQVLRIANTAGRGIEVRVRQPVFLKWVGGQNPELHFAALSTPKVDSPDPSGEQLVPFISAKIVSDVFANKVTGKIDFQVPGKLADTGLVGKTSRVNDGLIRVYYSKAGFNARSDSQIPDGATPTTEDALTIKLTRVLMTDLARPKANAAMAAAGVGLIDFQLQFEPANKLMWAVIVARMGREMSFSTITGNVKVSGNGNARVRQAIAASAVNHSTLTMKSVGNAVLVGDPWISDLHAHVDSPIGIGGGVGVGVPDEAVDAFWEFVKALGVQVSASVQPQTFEEDISVSPLSLTSVTVRSSDLSLELHGSTRSVAHQGLGPVRKPPAGSNGHP